MPLFVLPFPAIDPVLIQVGPFALRWYALAYIVGILLAWRYMRLLVANDRLWGGIARPTQLEIDDFVLWGTLGIIIGGRLEGAGQLGHRLFALQRFKRHLRLERSRVLLPLRHLVRLLLEDQDDLRS